MKFIADIMVGKLARYLRMAGNDVLYINNISDDKILEIAKSEGRIVLTRDSLMLQRRPVKNNSIKSVFIRYDGIIEQLVQIKNDLGIPLKPNLIRCIECNTELLKVQKENLKDKVPPYVYRTQKDFLHCPHCGKYYWRGTHYDNINNIFKLINTLG
ncbi:MAG: Mut7-C RNAse domain-containing protein [Actinobacteria bacterium]|nr:Mut7-C RNAse domain-containing protein [Actinomycetota bacterium]MCL5072892.1 Mut7-C RNAse domain-containing protein [Actinomycetota bacterium]